MPSFDVVSELDMHEVSNGLDQANREVNTRFDFKGSDAEFTLKDGMVTLSAQTDFQLQQMRDIMVAKLTKRGIDITCLKIDDPTLTGKVAQQKITLRQGIDAELAKKIVKLIKDKALKVQAAIQGNQVRVTGKKRDDLQEVIALLRETKLEMPLQYTNFRD